MIAETPLLKDEAGDSALADGLRYRGRKWSLWRAALFLGVTSLGLWAAILVFAFGVF